MEEFQTEYTKFEPYLYVAVVLLKDDSKKDIRYTPLVMPMLHKSETGLIKEMEKSFKIKDISPKVVTENIVIVKLKFDKDVPLRKEFWTDSGDDSRQENSELNNPLFLELFLNEDGYKFLVTPAGKDKKGWQRCYLAHAFKKPTTKNIEKYMIKSPIYVDPASKNAAFYTFFDSYGYDYVTGKKIKDGKAFWEN